MATGHEEDVLLGHSDDDIPVSSESKNIFCTLQNIQSTMESVANGINKMGDAFTALAAAGPKQVTDHPSTSKRCFDDLEEGETDDDDDYDDTDDVRSLLRSASNKQPPMEVEEASGSGSVLQEMDALLENDDNVGIAVDEKLANITN